MTDLAVVDTENEYDDATDMSETENDPRSVHARLLELIDADNICDLLEKDEIDAIGERVTREYRIDKESRAEWEKNNDAAMKLALQVSEEKNYPWPKAANVKFPLLTTAAIQFAARAYPAIVNGGELVKAKVIGKDEGGHKRARGDRIARHMSFQLTEEMEEWEGETDRLLHILPIVGVCYRKTYFDPLMGRNRSDLVTPDALVINDNARDMATVPRMTQIVPLYPTEIEERFRDKRFRKVELGPVQDGGEDDDAPHMFLEQHRRLDLDDDGYAEPYIVTVHEDTSKVVRIVANFDEDSIKVTDDGTVARIERVEYFTKYEFLPNPSGGFHSIGFGYLLRPINEAINSTLNQLLDAGHLSNVGGGFIGAGARLRGGSYRHKPGEWKPVDASGASLRENMVPLPIREPSAVLFNLLGLLIDAGKDISAVKDVMTGDSGNKGVQTATTTLALIEQGMQVFSAIYKRIYRALKSEYGKIYRLNGLYLSPETYFTVLDEQEAVSAQDYKAGDFDVVPVADPNVVTNMQKLARAEFLMQFKDDPMFNPMEIRRRMLDAASIDEVDEVLQKEPPPNPAMLAKADEIDLQKREQAVRAQEVDLKAEKQVYEIAKMKAETMKLLAEAEAAEAGPQIAIYEAQMQRLADRERLAADTLKAQPPTQGAQ